MTRWLLSLTLAFSTAVCFCTSARAAQDTCALHARVERRGADLVITNGDGVDWFEVSLTIRGEYFGPKKPRDKTESFRNAVLGVPVDTTRMALQDFHDRAGASWDADTMDAMFIDISARIGKAVCRYEGRIEVWVS